MTDEPRINYTEENIHERLSTIEDLDLKYSYSENYGNPVIHELTLENSGHGSGLLVEDVLTIKRPHLEILNQSLSYHIYLGKDGPFFSSL